MTDPTTDEHHTRDDVPDIMEEVRAIAPEAAHPGNEDEAVVCAEFPTIDGEYELLFELAPHDAGTLYWCRRVRDGKRPLMTMTVWYDMHGEEEPSMDNIKPIMDAFISHVDYNRVVQ